MIDDAEPQKNNGELCNVKMTPDYTRDKPAVDLSLPDAGAVIGAGNRTKGATAAEENDR
jgi:hypothetical protein